MTKISHLQLKYRVARRSCEHNLLKEIVRGYYINLKERQRSDDRSAMCSQTDSIPRANLADKEGELHLALHHLLKVYLELRYSIGLIKVLDTNLSL